MYRVRAQLVEVAIASHARTSFTNFEKCYFSKLTVYFEEDAAPESDSSAMEESRAARWWNKTAAEKVEVEEQHFSKTSTARSDAHELVSTFIPCMYVHVHISKARYVPTKPIKCVQNIKKSL